MNSIDDYNMIIYECDRNIKRINTSNCVLLSCELVSFILCSGLPFDNIVLIMCVEAVLFKYIMYSKYGSKGNNYKLKSECLEKREKVLELKR